MTQGAEEGSTTHPTRDSASTPSPSADPSIDRLLGSKVMMGRPVQASLLRYLADHQGEAVGEVEIAAAVFDKPNLDPKLDASVRVQIARLRQTLAEYAQEDGKEDDVVFEIPKGEYRLVALWRRPPQPIATPPAAHAPARPSRVWVLALAASLLLAFGWWLGSRWPAHAVIASATASPDALDPALLRIWGRFLNGPREPLVVFHRMKLTGEPSVGMRWFDAVRDQPPGNTRFTGVGQPMAIAALARLWRPGRPWLVRTQGSFHWEDGVERNLVLISLAPDPAILPKRFSLCRVGDTGGQAMVDTMPPDGGRRLYQPTRDAWGGEEFAFIHYRSAPGGNWMIHLNGTNTFAAWGAAEMVAYPESAARLLRALPLEDPLPAFEALLRVKVVDDTPVETEVVAVELGER